MDLKTYFERLSNAKLRTWIILIIAFAAFDSLVGFLLDDFRIDPIFISSASFIFACIAIATNKWDYWSQTFCEGVVLCGTVEALLQIFGKGLTLSHPRLYRFGPTVNQTFFVAVFSAFKILLVLNILKKNL